MALSDTYLQLGISKKEIADFAKTVGTRTNLPIEKQTTEKHSMARSLGQDLAKYGVRWTHTHIDVDWMIHELEKVLENPSKELSQLVWNTMSKADTSVLTAQFRPNQQYDTKTEPSTLILTLERQPWIPQENGGFVRPAEASRDLLPKGEGFAFDPDWPWIKAVRFGEEATKRIEERRTQQEAAEKLGIEDEALDDAKWFAGLDAEERQHLKSEHKKCMTDLPDHEPIAPLGDHYFSDVTREPIPTREPDGEPESVLANIHTWWSINRPATSEHYADQTYPSFFSPRQLYGSDDRTAWFTMFALACFQSLGRTQDVQHRSYIEGGWCDGWWPELAESHPPDDVGSWLEHLQHWSSAEHLDQDFLPWRRLFVDLYAVARWLDEYIEIIRNLPRIVEEHDIISLNNILRPTYSPEIRRLGLDATPLARSLGIGINWMIRELLRYGFYEVPDQNLMTPYCWASTRRVRNLLTRLGAAIEERADKDASSAIYEFVVENIGPDRARFDGDLDLPLQQITRATHQSDLQTCFAAGF